MYEHNIIDLRSEVQTAEQAQNEVCNNYSVIFAHILTNEEVAEALTKHYLRENFNIHPVLSE